MINSYEFKIKIMIHIQEMELTLCLVIKNAPLYENCFDQGDY